MTDKKRISIDKGKRNRSDRIDEILSNSIMFFFIIQSANSSLKTVFPSLADSLGGMISAISGGLIMFFVIRSMIYVWRRSRTAVVLSYLLFAAIYGVSLFINITSGAPINLLIRESLMWTMVWWLPMGLIIYSVRNKTILYSQIVRWSYLLSVVTLTAMISYVSNIINLNMDSLNRGNYNMFFSYMLVFPLIIHFNEIIDKHYKKNLVFFVVEFVAILINGSRGALLCIGGFLLLKFFLGNMSVANKIKLSFFAVLAASSLYFGSRIIFKELESYGITSRTLEKIAGGEGAESDDRWEMFGYAIDFIKERPVLGYGLGGDFYVMYKKVFGTEPESVKDALTVHNGFLQILMCFGVFFGSIAIFIFWRPLFLFPRIKDSYTRILMVILFSVFIIPNFAVGDGVFVKPGIALYIYLFYNWLNTRKRVRLKRIKDQKKKQNEFSKLQGEIAGQQQAIEGIGLSSV